MWSFHECIPRAILLTRSKVMLIHRPFTGLVESKFGTDRNKHGRRAARDKEMNCEKTLGRVYKMAAPLCRPRPAASASVCDLLRLVFDTAALQFLNTVSGRKPGGRRSQGRQQRVRRRVPLCPSSFSTAAGSPELISPIISRQTALGRRWVRAAASTKPFSVCSA
jgi:hypothetical protein